jgi:signal transduction histidine kinase
MQPDPDGKILILDDEPANVRLLEKILNRAGHTRLRSTTDPRQFASLLAEFDPDVVLLDLNMPYLDGFAVLEQLQELLPPRAILPVVVLTADISPQTRLRALSSGASDFLTKPFNHAEVLQRVRNFMRTRQLQLQVEEQNANLERLVEERTRELEAALEQLKQTQQQLVQQERLHAFGMMATGVAHDFNNALSTVLGYGEIALRECEKKADRGDLRAYLQTITTAAQDGAKMVTRLREFYRPADKGEPRVVVELNELITQAITITQPKWKSQALRAGVSIEIASELEDVPPICGDAAELREALTNLIFNAVDAMPNGGRITLRSRAEDERVFIEVSDTGMGMSEEVRRRCLEPFFSTKGDGGTGLGLAMVYGIIERHDGSLDIKSTRGAGTTFIISLPQTDAVGVDIVEERERVDRRLHVLVVDDQPVLCELLSDFLVNDYHTVVTANDASEALAKFAQDEFDLVITDQAMPGMTGEELAGAIKSQSPSTPVILLTGFGEISDDASASVIDFVVSKPVSLIEFRHALVRATSPVNGASANDEGDIATPQHDELDLATS